MPDGSKTDPLLVKAEPISDGGNASGIPYLRRGQKKKLHDGSQREELDNVREIALQTLSSAKKQRKEVLQASEQRFLCSLW